MEKLSSRQQRDVVFVVDDEPIVLNIVSSILEQAGFEVLRASSPGEALRIGSVHCTSINLLFAMS